MKLKNCILFFLLLSALISFLTAQQGGGNRGAGNGSGSGGRPKETTEALTAAAETDTRSHSIQLGGRLEPGTRINHKIPSDGYITTILVRTGERIKKDQPLIQIDRIDDVLGQYQPTIMTSRINGLVSEIHVQTEDEVSKGNAGVEIIKTSPLILKTLISDKDAFKISLNETVNGHASDNTLIKGRLKSRSVEPDYETGLFEMIFEFSRPGKAHPGEWIIVDLPIEKTKGIFVKRSLVIRRYGAFYLWVVTKDNTLEAREVELGNMFEKDVHIKKGLKQGETYLTAITGKEVEGDSLKTGKE